MKYSGAILTFLLATFAAQPSEAWTHGNAGGAAPAITYDITASPFNATCNGQLATAVLTIGSGSKNLSSATPLWSGGDLNKYIAVNGASNDPGSANALLSTIATVTDSTHVILADAATQAISSASEVVEWGNDDAAAFGTFKTTALTWQSTHSGLVQLNLPANGRCIFIANVSGNNFTAGINQLRILGSSSVLSSLQGASGASGFFLGGGSLGGQGFCPASCAKTATVSAGASAVTLLDSGQISLFNAGDWALMTGLDIQGFGQPINPGVFEYVQVLSATGSTVTFTAPLAYTYKSTWPNYDPTEAGAAKLVALNQLWNTSQEYDGVNIATGPFGTNAYGRSITFKNGSAERAFVTPTQNGSLIMSNYSVPNQLIEWDKDVSTVSITGGTFRQFQVQNAVPLSMSMTGGTITQGMNGTPQNFVGNGITIRGDLDVGATCCGYAKTFNCTNCEIDGLVDNGPFIYPTATARFTMASGIITMPNNTAVVGAANNGSGLIRLTLSNTGTLGNTGTSGFTTNKKAGVGNVGGVPNATGDWAITVIDATHLDLQGSTFAGSYTSGGGIGDQPVYWAQPGANIIWSGSLPSELVSQVTDVTQDNTNVYVQTNLPGGFPSTIPTTGGNLNLQAHPSPNFSCSGCTGGGNAVMLANSGALGQPLWSYAKYTMVAQNVSISISSPAVFTLADHHFVLNERISVSSTGTLPSGLTAGIEYYIIPVDATTFQVAASPNGSAVNTSGSQSGQAFIVANPSVPIYGEMTNVNITVNTAYTGAASPVFTLDGPQILNGTTTPGSWNPTWNPKVTGARTVTPTTVGGTQSGDNFTAPGTGTWFVSNQITPHFSPLPSDFGATSVTIEMITNQGVVP